MTILNKRKTNAERQDIPKSNSFLSEIEYLKNMVMEQILLEDIDAKMIC